MNTVIAIVFLLLFFPCNAWAYLDPASGNAVVSFLVAIGGASLYFLKSIFFKIFSGGRTLNTEKKSSVKGVIKDFSPIIFSEGKSYWSTFKPIVEELIKRKIHFRYITLDVHDPALVIDCEYMQAKRYAKNSWGFAKIAKLEGGIMLSTTPNIGCTEYPMKRPPRVDELVHVFHAFVDISCYKKGSLDFYDTVLMAGPHEEKYIRIVEEARNIPAKHCIVAGLPYIDTLSTELSAVRPIANEKKLQTVLVAPSWGAKGCFSSYGTGFVGDLARAGYKVLIRLHPQSYISEMEKVQCWQDELQQYSNVFWDSNQNSTEVMSQADILISDTSSVRFDFSFLHLKPVVTLRIPQDELTGYEGDYMNDTWANTITPSIGSSIDHSEISNILSVVQQTLDNFDTSKFKSLRDKILPNFGVSASYIADYFQARFIYHSMSPVERELHCEVNSLKKRVYTMEQCLLVKNAAGQTVSKEVQ